MAVDEVSQETLDSGLVRGSAAFGDSDLLHLVVRVFLLCVALETDSVVETLFAVEPELVLDQPPLALVTVPPEGTLLLDILTLHLAHVLLHPHW